MYAENDHFFGPQFAAAFYQAFTRSGGKAEFIRAAAFRRDGHGLFSPGGIPLWTPMVDGFLAGQSLKLRADLLALPVAPDLPPPNALSPEGRQEWKVFLTYPQHRAFAVSDLGHFAYSYGRSSDKDARKLAMEHCEDAAPHGDHCELVDTQP